MYARKEKKRSSRKSASVEGARKLAYQLSEGLAYGRASKTRMSTASMTSCETMSCEAEAE